MDGEAAPQLSPSVLTGSTVAIAGNPNTGKSTLFNRLTGARQKVSNYPGETVEKRTGVMIVAGEAVQLVDLPGAYSLTPASADEHVVIDVLAGRRDDTPRPRVVVCVVDAGNLRRNLFLASQISELGLPIVIALNMIDEAENAGMNIDAKALSGRLGVPVVPTIAMQGQGVQELREAVHKALLERPAFAAVPFPKPIRDARSRINQAVRHGDGVMLSEGELTRLLFDVESPISSKLSWDGSYAEQTLQQARESLEQAGFDPISVEAEHRYAHIDQLLRGLIARTPTERPSLTPAIDQILVHRIFGFFIFVAMMFGVFSSIYWLAQPLMDLIDFSFTVFGAWVGSVLSGTPMLQSLLVDGVIAGVGSVTIFLPQILILFFFIAVLEDTGYMARAAFLMDKIFSWCGLNGKSFVPMLSSFACAVPSIMGTRTIEDPRARLTTILIAPLMSCSGRLPVYILLIAAFIEPVYGAFWAGVTLFGMHFLGLFVAIPVAFILSRFVLKVKPIPFLLEMPPYRIPKLRDVTWRMFLNGREFVVRAGTVILAFSIIIWALSYFPRPANHPEQLEQAASSVETLPVRSAETLNGTSLEQSYIGRAGRAIQPIFALAGFDWKISVGLLASFPAREVFISTMGIIYNLSDQELQGREESGILRERLASARWSDGTLVYTPTVALALMVFYAFCLQCGSTVVMIARESRWKWAVFAFCYMTTLSWIGAVAVYQIGTAIAAAGSGV